STRRAGRPRRAAAPPRPTSGSLPRHLVEPNLRYAVLARPPHHAGTLRRHTMPGRLRARDSWLRSAGRMADGVERRLGTVGDAQLGEHRTHMRLDRLLGD